VEQDLKDWVRREQGAIHQSPRCIVSPTVGGKVYEGGPTKNEQVRRHTVEVSLHIFYEIL
jgi:hypothetical protein